MDAKKLLKKHLEIHIPSGVYMSEKQLLQARNDAAIDAINEALELNAPKEKTETLRNMAFGNVSDEDFTKFAVQFGVIFTEEQKKGGYKDTYMIIRKTVRGVKLNQILFVKHLENETLEDCVKRLQLN